MKINELQKLATLVTIASLVGSASTALAQDSSAANPAPTAAASASVPPLAYGVPQIVQLARANVGEATIIAFVKNSGNSYGLNADQIIYLRQQGVSDAVITTMLDQPRPRVAIAMPSTPAPLPAASIAYSGQASTAAVAPAVSYVQTVPEATYYDPPYYYQPDYYYPDYGWYSPGAFNFGWGGGFYGGGWGGRGGYGGGGHGGAYGGGGHGGGYGGGRGGSGHGGGHR